MAESGDQEWLQGLLQNRGEEEETPNAVDDARDASEQLNSNANRPSQKWEGKAP